MPKMQKILPGLHSHRAGLLWVHLRCWLALELMLPCKHMLRRFRGCSSSAATALLQRYMELQMQLMSTASYRLAFWRYEPSYLETLCGLCSA